MTKLTKEHIEAQIKSESYVLRGRTTICLLQLRNDFVATGESHCFNPSDFNNGLGQKYARKMAVEKIYELEAYRLKCRERADEVLRPVAKHVYNARYNTNTSEDQVAEIYGINKGDIAEAIAIHLDNPY